MAQAPRTPRFLCWLQVRLLLLILLAVSPAIALTIWGATAQRQEAKRTAEAEVSRLARIAAGDQQHFVAGASQFLAALDDVPAVKDMDVAAADSLFAHLLSSFPVYQNIGLMDADGWIVASALPLAQRINSSDRPFFQRAMATRAFAVGDYQIGRITKKATVNFARPVFGRDGRVRGVLFVALGLDWLARLASQVDLPPGATLRVVDGNGTILARQPDGPEWVGQRIEEHALLEAAQSRPEGLVEETGLDGVPRIYAYATMSGAHDGRILVTAGYSKDVLYAGANRAFAWAIAVLVFVTLLAVFLAWLGGEALILRPVRSLAAAADRLRGGDLRARTG
ncbi:MAG TPA: cache domain-containing protein, partial [Candidatus Eisenbacteria bacterium]